MTIHLVGAIGANLKPLWRRILERGGGQMIVALAGTFSRPYCVEAWYRAAGIETEGGHNSRDEMDVYLAGIQGRRKGFVLAPEGGAADDDTSRGSGTVEGNGALRPGVAGGEERRGGVHILESFYYADDFTERMIPYFGKFLLDSGAFTFFSNGHTAKGVVWEEYVDRYADFILRNRVENFFELDIDKLVGFSRVLELRRRLENKVGRQSIPVWHKSRGKDGFLRMCDEYKYVAIGGVVSKEVTQDDWRFFPWFIDTAHKRGCRIHGLGFTALSYLPRYHFDSVDSTAWTTGNRFGAVYRFNGRTMEKVLKGEGQRLGDSRAVAINNFNEWVKFQRWAETHL